jgi:hypothetical protein
LCPIYVTPPTTPAPGGCQILQSTNSPGTLHPLELSNPRSRFFLPLFHLFSPFSASLPLLGVIVSEGVKKGLIAPADVARLQSKFEIWMANCRGRLLPFIIHEPTISWFLRWVSYGPDEPRRTFASSPRLRHHGRNLHRVPLEQSAVPLQLRPRCVAFTKRSTPVCSGTRPRSFRS